MAEAYEMQDTKSFATEKYLNEVIYNQSSSSQGPLKE